MAFILTRRSTKLINNNTSRLAHIVRKMLEGRTAIRAAKLAAVVGSILVIINQGDSIAQGIPPDWFKALLTYIVPYCVSTWTSIAKDLEKNRTHCNNTPAD